MITRKKDRREEVRVSGFNEKGGRRGKEGRAYKAPPPPPKALLNPILATCNSLGKSFVAMTMTAGQNGPMKNPKNAMATADTMNCGTSQKSSSSPIPQIM